MNRIASTCNGLASVGQVGMVAIHVSQGSPVLAALHVIAAVGFAFACGVFWTLT